MTRINNPLNWELIRRELYTTQAISQGFFIPIPAIEILADSRVLLFGFKNSQAPTRWRYAATVSMKMLGTPIFSPDFDTAMLPYNRSCKLNKLNLVQFPNYQITPFLVEINIAKWHKEMLLEVWQYIGDEVNLLSQSITILNRLETKIDSLNV